LAKTQQGCELDVSTQTSQLTQTVAQNEQPISQRLNYDPILLETFKLAAKSEDFSQGVSPRNYDPILCLS
jgi:hypothetical protein